MRTDEAESHVVAGMPEVDRKYGKEGICGWDELARSQNRQGNTRGAASGLLDRGSVSTHR
jgi:hypothetical protein